MSMCPLWESTVNTIYYSVDYPYLLYFISNNMVNYTENLLNATLFLAAVLGRARAVFEVTRNGTTWCGAPLTRCSSACSRLIASSGIITRVFICGPTMADKRAEVEAPNALLSSVLQTCVACLSAR